jgi:hypothetical protein
MSLKERHISSHRRAWLIRPGRWLALLGLVFQLFAPAFVSGEAASLPAKLAQSGLPAGFGDSICHNSGNDPASPSAPGKSGPGHSLSCLLCCALHQSAGLPPPSGFSLPAASPEGQASVRFAAAILPRPRYLSAEPRAPPARAAV